MDNGYRELDGCHNCFFSVWSETGHESTAYCCCLGLIPGGDTFHIAYKSQIPDPEERLVSEHGCCNLWLSENEFYDKKKGEGGDGKPYLRRQKRIRKIYEEYAGKGAKQ